MWILSIFAEIAIHLVLTISTLVLVAFYIWRFTIISQYKLAIQLCGVILFAFSVYLEGGLAESYSWKLKSKRNGSKNS